MKETHVCRCCLSSGCCKDLSSNYTCDGKTENYGEMLSKTFDLTINCLKKFICEDCIPKLREAATFKQQILEANNAFNNFKDSLSFEHDDLKTEDGIFSIKSEIADNEANCENSRSEMEKITKIIIENEKIKNKVKNKSTPEKELQKDQRDNSIKLISNSNICIFKSLRTRFACYICNEKFFDINQLRNHSKIHSTDDFKKKLKRLRGKSFENVDISNLTCSLCSNNCSDLENLREHLAGEHKIQFADVNHILIPYKLEEGLRCQVCNDNFNTFTRLSIHMNTHATSNVCETCGMAFFNRISLRNHIRAIHKDHYCHKCSLKFTTMTKLVAHKQKTHKAALSKHYCLRCNTTFRYPYLLKRHMVERHGDKYTTVECNACQKVFKDSNCMKTHFRSVHLNERNYACSVCDLRFFTRNGRGRHERIHEGGSLYSCHLCETKFKSKDSIRRHMRKQHDNIK